MHIQTDKNKKIIVFFLKVPQPTRSSNTSISSSNILSTSSQYFTTLESFVHNRRITKTGRFSSGLRAFSRGYHSCSINIV